MDKDELVEKYAKLCDFFWRLEHPETPKDGLRHTSARCRALSREVFELLEIEDLR